MSHSKCQHVFAVFVDKCNRKQVVLLLILMQVCLIGIYYKSLLNFNIKQPTVAVQTKSLKKDLSVETENELLHSRISELEGDVDELRSALLKIQAKQSDSGRFLQFRKALSHEKDLLKEDEYPEDYKFAENFKTEDNQYIHEKTHKKYYKETDIVSKNSKNGNFENQYDGFVEKDDLNENYSDDSNKNIAEENVDQNYENSNLEDENIKEEDYEKEDENTSSLKKCPKYPRHLKERYSIDFNSLPEVIPYAVIEAANPLIRNGGQFTPPNCKPKWKVAIIIPYRNRENHLRIFLYFMHPILQRHDIHYRIYVINQGGDEKFNRAKLLNVGFSEALKDENFDCFVFHDVDHILINDMALYTCPPSPRHLSHSVDKYGWGLPYEDMFGGVSQLTREQFQKINGFSNTYWGWGAEDDDLRIRIESNGYKIIRYPIDIAVYMMIPHLRDVGNENNPIKDEKLEYTLSTMRKDGLSSLNYTVISRDIHKLYTNITVDIGRCGKECPESKTYSRDYNFNNRVIDFKVKLNKLRQQLKEGRLLMEQQQLLAQQKILQQHRQQQNIQPQYIK